MQSRRDFLKYVGITATSLGLPGCSTNRARNPNSHSTRPNIILILTDDQGYGDVGFHGNEVIQTPNLDQFAKEGVDFSRFYVAPVCSPTRAGIMTGRYHYRTGVTNVGSCGDRIKAEELTIAEILRRSGYATAIYGKWHMGDNYPMRPQDMGFEEAIIHKGCCLTPWFRPGGDNYFDPYLFHNGVRKQYKGYCMDVFTDLTIDFARKNAKQNKPFFVYLSTNTPHDPLNVGREYSEPYRQRGLGPQEAEYYGTITNIDYNVGRLMSKLKEMGLDEDTIVVFLTDNGASGGGTRHWSLKLRGKKASVYEGGIRVPCVFRWPGKFKSGSEIDRIAAYTDLLPTFLDAAQVASPEGINLDGESLMPLLEGRPGKYPDRTIIIQWHQGLTPQLHRSFTVIHKRFKLVQAVGGFQQSGKYLENEYRYELFDILNDPLEQNDLASEYPHIVSMMKQQYEEWYWEMMKERGLDPQEIIIGSIFENPTRLLTSGSFVEQDEAPNFVTGEWPCHVVRSGRYDIKFVFHKGLESDGSMHFKLGEVSLNKHIPKGIVEDVFKGIWLQEGSDWLECFLKPEEKNIKRIVPTYLDIQFIGD